MTRPRLTPQQGHRQPRPAQRLNRPLFRGLQALLLLLPLAMLGLATTGCDGAKAKEAEKVAAGKPAPVTADEVDAMYALYLGGRYDAYVALMLSCDDKPDSYRRDMVNLYKQHAADRAADESRRAVHAKTQRVEMAEDGSAATAIVCVTYADSTYEDVMLELIHDGSRWRLR